MKVTLKRSLIGVRKDQRATLYALGLRKTGDTREVIDNESTRGMLDKVSYLIEVEGRESK